MGRKLEIDQARMMELYHAGKTYHEIGAALGCTGHAVAARLNRMGLYRKRKKLSVANDANITCYDTREQIDICLNCPLEQCMVKRVACPLRRPNWKKA